MKTKREYSDLKGTEKECYDFLRDNQKAIDNNTEWCIAFWEEKMCVDFFDGKSFNDFIRQYPPESLTKYRRNLVFDGLITPSKESKEHSIEQEKKNHVPQYQHQAENDWSSTFKRQNPLN